MTLTIISYPFSFVNFKYAKGMIKNEEKNRRQMGQNYKGQ